MRETEEKAVTTIQEVTVRTLCDCCGEEIRKGSGVNTKIEITKTTGTVEGGTGVSYDLCPSCWDEEIAPLMKTGPFEHGW